MSVLYVSGTLLGAEEIATGVTDKILLSWNVNFSEENRFLKKK